MNDSPTRFPGESKGGSRLPGEAPSRQLLAAATDETGPAIQAAASAAASYCSRIQALARFALAG